MAERGQIATASQKRRQAAAPGPQAPCNVDLYCGREQADELQKYDMTGLAAMVCSHVFPGRNLVVGMPTPEQFLFYDIILTELLRTRPDTDILYLDVACQYKKGWAATVQNEIDRGSLSNQASRLKLLVPWMHGASHDLDCQLENSGLYQVCMSLSISLSCVC